ncbi:hypothetical protein SpiGrapes_2416 [Sphaerochaeta pleomorpha str. Grapes]|uniref:L-fucose isomerase family protein n=1 Tax=Sphaerochaeta pleomorpha (strain ATCC BAA-1885 / DSM 22778 / Grapes) TaxID=158190 RepID=G8QTE5_SPHPG|nr:hypothetical protein [Sphaerochaeta pleomorpha]AEV30186.1 hypothetical protein SpiGrapes_2416 [Sphaerochaeta pleomorpha str. Grapes]
MLNLYEKQKMGLLLIGAERFRPLGSNTKRGSYLERKTAEADSMVSDCGKFAEVVFPGIVFTREDAVSAIKTFTKEDVDYVLCVFLSWAEDFAWNRFLRDMPPIPILYAHNVKDQVNLGNTSDDDEFTEYLCYGGLVGSLEASGDNIRYNRPMFETVLGTWSEVLKRSYVFGKAAHARALLRKSSMGLLACFNEAMWSTYVDPYDIFMKVGPELHFLSVAELRDTIEAIPDGEVASVMEDLKRTYVMEEDVDLHKFFASVRASMGMERLATHYDLDLLVLNDIDTVLFQQVGLRPGFWPTANEVKTLVVPEGDIGGGLAAYLLKLVSQKRVNFIEPFHLDLPNDNFAAGHAGPNDYREEGGKTLIARDVRFAKTKWKYAGAPFAWHTFSPGIKTMVHCSERNGSFILVATKVECLPTEHFLATYSHGLFRAIGQTNEQLFEKLLKIGVTQHYSIVSGDYVEILKDLASLLGFEFFSL